MNYSGFQDTKSYLEKRAGARLVIMFVEYLPGPPPEVREHIGFSGISSGEDYEQIAIEEAGNDGVDEIVTGRHSGSANLNGFWSPEYNDTMLPTRNNFFGREFTVFIMTPKDDPDAPDQVLDVFTGCKINRSGSQFGARGPRSFDLSVMFKQRYNGLEWSTIAVAAN